jgi:hypothetical protein
MPSLKLSVIYVVDFRGDNYPSILGLYVIKQNEYEQAISAHMDLNKVLEKSTKISNWQDQIYLYEGIYFLVKLELEGNWEFGGVFSEKNIKSIKIYKMEASKKIKLECENSL